MPAARPAATNPGGGDAHGYTPASGSPVLSGRPSARLAHWTAWPAAPLTRLSMAASTTHPAGAGVDPDRQVRGVRSAGRLGRRRGVGHDDEGLVVVAVVQELHGVLRGEPAGVGGSGVTGGQDAPHHGGQVGREQDRACRGPAPSRRCGGGRAARRRRSPRRPRRSGVVLGARPAPDAPLAASTTRAGPRRPAASGRRPRPAGRAPAAPPSGATGGGDPVAPTSSSRCSSGSP